MGPWSQHPIPNLAPRAARLDVDRGVLGTLGDIEPRVQAEPPRDEVAKTRALGGDGIGVAEAGAGAPGAAVAEEADERPARRQVPAELGFHRARALVLVAHHRDAAQLDEGQ